LEIKWSKDVDTFWSALINRMDFAMLVARGGRSGRIGARAPDLLWGEFGKGKKARREINDGAPMS